MIRCLALLLGWLILGFAGSEARAHALEPGYLEITSIAEGTYRVFWRKPDVTGQPMAIDPRLPETCDARSAPPVQSDGQAWTSAWIAACPGGLAGGEIAIEGLDRTETDVLVRYSADDGAMRSARLTSKDTTLIVPANPGNWDVLSTYLPLGVEHILGGIDHLLFVFALLLLIQDRWRLIGAITAFTVAHSITMAVATLGWVTLPGPPVEAVIALSIMFLASELFRGGSGERLSERYPWTVSFAFGLLHGFGFAGALKEIGVPETDVPLALLSFNLGVEIGQIAFVLAVLAVWWGLGRVFAAGPRLVARGTPVFSLCVYAIGGISAFWLIERIAAF